MLAGLLKWPQATFASEVHLSNDSSEAEVHREVDGGIERISVQLPAVMTTDLRLNTPRYPTLPRMMKAKREPIETLTLADFPHLENHPAQLDVTEVTEPPKRMQGVMVDSVNELVSKLRNERKVL